MHQDRCKTYWLGGTKLLADAHPHPIWSEGYKSKKAKNKNILYVGKITLKIARYHYKMTKEPL